MATDNRHSAVVGRVEFLRGLRRDKWLVVALIGTLTAVAAVSSFLMTPVYRAEVRISPVSETDRLGGAANLAGEFGGLAALAGINLTHSDNSQIYLAMLKSRSFAEEFILQEQLLPALFFDRWDPEAKEWVAGEDPPTIREAYRYFDEEVRDITEDKRTGLVNVGISWTDPALAAEWANRYVEMLNGRVREEALEESRQSVQFLEDALENVAYVGLRQVIFQVVESELQKAALANIREDYAYKIIDPAVVLDDDMFTQPKRLVIIGSGFLFGVLLSVILVLMRINSRRSRINNLP